MQTLVKFFRKIDLVNEWIGRVICWLIVVMFIIICFEIFMRYVLGMPTIWVHETAGFLLIYAGMLGGGYTLLHKGHVNVDILYARIPDRGRAILDLCTWLLFYAFVIVIMWKGSQMAWTAIERLERTNTFWRPPEYPIKAIVPIGAFLAFLQGLPKTAHDLALAITGRELVPPAEVETEEEILSTEQE